MYVVLRHEKNCIRLPQVVIDVPVCARVGGSPDQSYRNSRDNSVHQYMARINNIYIIFFPFSYLHSYCDTDWSYTLHPQMLLLISIEQLSFGVFTCKYAPGTSKVATSLPSYAYITSVVNNPYRNTVGDATLSPSLKYLFYLLPFAQVLPLMIPFIFPFLVFVA